MLTFSLLTNLRLFVILLLRPRLLRWWKRLQRVYRTIKRRDWKPVSPHDRPQCRAGVGLQIIKP